MSLCRSETHSHCGANEKGKDMKNKLLLSLAIAIACAVLVALLIITKPKPAPAPPSEELARVNVAVTPARPESLSLSVTAQGEVLPKREIELVAQVAGQIVSVQDNFVAGGFFAKNEKLIQIDDRDYQVAVLQAKAQVAAAQQRVAEEEGLARQAKREWRDLGNQRANDLFMRKPQLAAAKANLASAEGALALAELNLERTRVVLPFDGRVKTLHADLGQFVSTGSPIATVYDSSLVEVRLPLTEKQAALIDLPLVPKISDRRARPPVRISASVAGSSHEWLGQLVRTDAFVDAQSRMYFAVVEVNDPFGLDAPHAPINQAHVPLLPGLFVDAEISGKLIENVIELPREALFKRDKLLVLSEDNVANIQHVEVLHSDVETVWLKAPLTRDTLVATEKQFLISEGSTVTPIETKTDPVLAASQSTEQVKAKQ